MKHVLPVEALRVVSSSPYADTPKLQSLCLALSNWCRQELPWSLVVQQGMPLSLMSLYLLGEGGADVCRAARTAKCVNCRRANFAQAELPQRTTTVNTAPS